MAPGGGPTALGGGSHRPGLGAGGFQGPGPGHGVGSHSPGGVPGTRPRPWGGGPHRPTSPDHREEPPLRPPSRPEGFPTPSSLPPPSGRLQTPSSTKAQVRLRLGRAVGAAHAQSRPGSNGGARPPVAHRYAPPPPPVPGEQVTGRGGGEIPAPIAMGGLCLFSLPVSAPSTPPRGLSPPPPPASLHPKPGPCHPPEGPDTAPSPPQVFLPKSTPPYVSTPPPPTKPRPLPPPPAPSPLLQPRFPLPPSPQ